MVLTNKVYLESCRVLVGGEEECYKRLHVSSKLYFRRSSLASLFDIRKVILIDDIIKRKLPWC